jgi:folate-binding protein YgfZ
MAPVPLPPASIWFEVRDFWAVEVSGKHASRYLQSRTTLDLRNLAPGISGQAAALNPQGRTQALFTIACRAENSYLIVGDGSDEAQGVAALSKFIVADRVDIRKISAEYRCFHCVRQIPAHGGQFEQLEGSYFLPRKRLFRAGLDIVVPRDSADSLMAKFSADLGPQSTLETAEYWRIAGGVPAFPSELNESRNLMEGYPKGCLSFDKGCYAGQEVVEKVSALGKAPRVLCSMIFETGSKPAVGTEIFLASDTGRPQGSSIGAVTSSAALGGHCAVFASIKNDPTLLTGPFSIASSIGRSAASVYPPDNDLPS